MKSDSSIDRHEEQLPHSLHLPPQRSHPPRTPAARRPRVDVGEGVGHVSAQRRRGGRHRLLDFVAQAAEGEEDLQEREKNETHDES